MEKKTRWMLMHPQVPGRFSGAAVLFCQPSHAIHATSAETGQGERLRRRRGSQCWAPCLVPTAGSLSGEPRSCPVRCAALAAACLQPLSPAKHSGSGHPWGGPVLLGCVVNCGLPVVSGFHTGCSLCLHLCIPSAHRGSEDAWWDLAPVSHIYYF